MTETTSDQLIKAIADTEDTEPADLDVMLQDHVSMDAILQLRNHSNDKWRLQFETPNHVVELVGDKTILVDGKNSA